MKILNRNSLLLVPLVFIVAGLWIGGCAASPDSSATVSEPDAVAPDPGEPVSVGDLVTVHYTVSLEDGTLVGTTRAEDLSDPGRRRSDLFSFPESPLPEDFVVGNSGLFDGFDRSLVGMRVGERREIRIPPNAGFGDIDPDGREVFSRIQRMPRRVRMPADYYQSRFHAPPQPGEQVRLVPHFSHRVESVEDGQVELEAVVENGAVFEDDLGTTRITVGEREIWRELTPRIGARIDINGRNGRITAVEGDAMTVDFNHPLAGRFLVLDLEVLDRIDAKTVEASSIDWHTDPDAAQEKAFLEDLPQVVVLHREGCSWCDKLFDETMVDPRVERFHDQFVWASVDTGEDPDLKARFRQDGTPNIIVLDPAGNEILRNNGYLDAPSLNRMLRTARSKIKAKG
ncbi:MAG: FKBP-type peptidyl-prolyl cis-trans isomerase [Desulfobacterales bacterium]